MEQKSQEFYVFDNRKDKKWASLTFLMFTKSIQQVFQRHTKNLYLSGHSTVDLKNEKKPMLSK